MKGNMMILAPLCLLLCWMSPEGSMAVNDPIPLTMEEDSVDDMYLGCREGMMNKVKKQYLKKEKKDMMWDHKVIKDCTTEKVEQNMNNALTEDHLRAICSYTAAVTHVGFNKAVRTERQNYGSSFKYHSLHFLLTSAIQILRPNQNICYTVYRRTNYNYVGDVNQIMRFGFFASTSLKTDLTNFGANSCFKIKTCLGTYLTNNAIILEQKEVLIPPYEQFKITEVHDGKGTFTELKDCLKVFVLESIGAKSYLNCKLVPPKTN